MILPGGLASEAKIKGTKFCVQTEFAQRPKPRVTTTIFVNGAVVEKVENVWDRLPQTEEDRTEIERFLKKQHKQVLEELKDRGDGIISPGPEVKETADPKETLALKVARELSKTDGVFGWVFVSKQERVRASEVSEDEEEDSDDIVRSVKRLSLLLPSVTTLGDFVGGILEVPDSRMIFLPLEEQFLAIQLDPEVDARGLVKRIKSLA
jgi:hypothetical protein